MEDLAAYAAMAAASVGLYKELLLPYENDRQYSRSSPHSSSFISNRLTSIRRQEEEEDDINMTILSSLWEDELIAVQSLTEANTVTTNPQQQNFTSSTLLPQAKRSKTASMVASTSSPSIYSPYDLYNLKLNLDTSSSYHHRDSQHQFINNSNNNRVVGSEFCQEDAYRIQHDEFNSHRHQQEQQSHHHQHHLSENERPFIGEFSANHHHHHEN